MTGQFTKGSTRYEFSCATDDNAQIQDVSVHKLGSRGGNNAAGVALAAAAILGIAALASHAGNRNATAKALGISERTLRYRLASMRASGMVAGGRA